MIVTVTMNPAIDKTVEIEEFHRGGLNRIQRSLLDAGGKGINVSKTIHALGGTSIATGFLGGSSGQTIWKLLQDWRIPCDFVWVDGETRTNTKVFEKNGMLTELNEPGPGITEKEVSQLLSKLDQYADPRTLFVLSGSIPAGIDKGIYGEIIARVHKKGAKVLLDADGEAFAKALPATPDIIKPNLEELQTYMRQTYTQFEELYSWTHQLQETGIDTVILSMGAEGALFVGRESVVCPGLPVKIHSTVGAGDAMAAAWAYGWDQKLDFQSCVNLAMAASAGAVMTEGTKPPNLDVVRKLMQEVIQQRPV